MTSGRFLGGVAAVVFDPIQRRYLLLQRAADKDFGAGVWEPVTGRVEQGESFEAAIRRETLEEIGVVPVLEAILGTTHFHRGAPVPDNELLGVVFLATLTEFHQVRIGPEHAAHRWVTLAEADALLTATDPGTHWCRRVLARADAMRRLLPPALLEYRRANPFDFD